MEIQAER